MALLNQLDIPSLGRPFKLGMLYDGHRDNLINKSPWPDGTLKPRITNTLRQFPKKILPNEKSVTKLRALEVKGDLGLSVLAELTESNNLIDFVGTSVLPSINARVVLYHKCITRSEHVDMNCLPNIDTMADDQATHVVTSIQYGFEGFFVFECDVSDDEGPGINVIQSQLDAAVKATCMLKKKSSLKFQDTPTFLQSIECTFYGESQLPLNVATLDDAVEFFKQLPSLLGDGKTPCDAVSVHLCPLNKISKNIALAITPVSEQTIKKLEALIDSLDDVVAQNNDLLLHLEPLFSITSSQLTQLLECISYFKASIISEISLLLLSVRQCQDQEKSLLSLGDKKHSVVKNIATWIEAKKQEISRLQSCINSLLKTSG